MSTLQRVYSASDADMLTAIATIVDNAIEKKEFLISKRTVWADPYFPDLKKRIEEAVNRILGINSMAQLRAMTSKVVVARATATNQLSELKVQIKVDFADDNDTAKSMLSNLGLMSGGKMVKVENLSSQAFSQLLQKVKTGLTPEVRKQIEEKGTTPKLLDDIIANAGTFFELNTTQEVQKGLSSTLTNSSIAELNSLYNEVMAVAKIARVFLKGQPKAERDKFSFNAIIKRQGGAAATKAGDADKPESK